jgi:hypothetical protein
MLATDFRTELSSVLTNLDKTKIDPDLVVPHESKSIEFSTLFSRISNEDEIKNLYVAIDENQICFIRNRIPIFIITKESGVNIITEMKNGIQNYIGKSIRLVDALYLIRYKLSEQTLLSDVSPEHRWKHIDPMSDEWKSLIPPKYKRWLGGRRKFLWSRDHDWGDGGAPTIQLFQQSPWKLLYSIYPHRHNEDDCFYTRCQQDHDDINLKHINKTLE